MVVSTPLENEMKRAATRLIENIREASWLAYALLLVDPITQVGNFSLTVNELSLKNRQEGNASQWSVKRQTNTIQSPS